MTAKQFVNEVQAYYAPFEPAVAKYVWQWISRGWTEEARKLIFAELIRSFSTRWGKAPGVSELEEAWRRVQSNREVELRESEEQLQLPGESEDPVDAEEALDRLEELKQELESLAEAKRPEEEAEHGDRA
jgi:hypothetical protein